MGPQKGNAGEERDRLCKMQFGRQSPGEPGQELSETLAKPHIKKHLCSTEVLSLKSPHKHGFPFWNAKSKKFLHSCAPDTAEFSWRMFYEYPVQYLNGLLRSRLPGMGASHCAGMVRRKVRHAYGATGTGLAAHPGW